jgi:hypothetical protein
VEVYKGSKTTQRMRDKSIEEKSARMSHAIPQLVALSLALSLSLSPFLSFSRESDIRVWSDVVRN